MNNEVDVQVMTGPSASVVHHATAWVQGVTGLDAAPSLMVTLCLGVIGLTAVVAAVRAIYSVVALPSHLRH